MLCGCAQHTGGAVGCSAHVPAARLPKAGAPCSLLPYSPAALSEHPGREPLGGSVTLAGVAGLLSLHFVPVLHGPVIGNLDRLADVGLAAFQHLLLIQVLVHAQGHEFGAGQPLPAEMECAKVTRALPKTRGLFRPPFPPFP